MIWYACFYTSHNLPVVLLSALELKFENHLFSQDNHVIFKNDTFHHKHNIERLSKKSYDGNPTSKEDGSLGPSFIGENEDSVSEVFKVKRTIVVKADKSIALNNASSSFSEHQV